MKRIRDFTTEELKQELKERKKEELARKVLPPVPFDRPDFNEVQKTVAEFITIISQSGYYPEDVETDVCDAVLEAIYGGDIFTWISNRVKMGATRKDDGDD